MAADAPPKEQTSKTTPPPASPAADAPPKATRQPKVRDSEGERGDKPIPDGRGGYLLPRSLRNLDVSALTPGREDENCPDCGSPLFARIDVVRNAQGYSSQGGQKRGVLLVCLGCGEALNGHEIKDW